MQVSKPSRFWLSGTGSTEVIDQLLETFHARQGRHIDKEDRIASAHAVAGSGGPRGKESQ